ncbi:MAG: hybrid sensor histidine kinase/response regulator [Chloroflexota bacterium]
MDERTDTSILVVEDEAMVNELVQDQLTRLGYTICGAAYDSAEALSLVSELEPDLVVMDVQMPDPVSGVTDSMAGINAAKIIHDQASIPIVLLTAHESQNLVAEASNAGVAAYLVKPVTGKRLDRAIAIALARHGDLLSLRQINEILRDRNEELDTFAHTVAHDLRGPLSNIIGFSSLLVEDLGHGVEPEIASCLEGILSNSNKMNNIIDELLLLAEVRRRESLVMVPLDMARIVRDASRRLDRMIRKSGTDIVHPDQWPVALGYGPWVEEIWVNYLSNAVKYGGDPPHIELGATRVNHDQLRFWVQDNGRGILDHEIDRLFTPFTRLDQTHATGYGLGLSIVRRIAERLGGAVGVTSELGVGSRFSFTLPAVKS